MPERANAVDRLADLARCGTSRATALAFMVGQPAWGRCVRVRDHEGDCVMGLNALEEAKLADEEVPWSVGWVLKSKAELRAKRLLAEEWGLR